MLLRPAITVQMQQLEEHGRRCRSSSGWAMARANRRGRDPAKDRASDRGNACRMRSGDCPAQRRQGRARLGGRRQHGEIFRAQGLGRVQGKASRASSCGLPCATGRRPSRRLRELTLDLAIMGRPPENLDLESRRAWRSSAHHRCRGRPSACRHAGYDCGPCERDVLHPRARLRHPHAHGKPVPGAQASRQMSAWRSARTRPSSRP